MEPSSYGYSLDDFMEEARELLARAEGVLSGLRESPHDMERVNALFRVIHSLKGSAAYAGLADVNTFAHLYESFLGDLRHKKYDVNRDVLNILIRATDYLDDLISQPESAEVLKIDESLGDSMRQISAVLSGRRGGLPWRENIVSLSPLLGKAEQGAESKAPQQENVSLPTQHPDRMGQDDIIKITIMNDLKAFFSCLKEQAPEKAIVSKLFTKLEDGALWAFGDSAELVRLFGEMEGIVSGDIGANELLQLRKGFNSLAAALKKELAGLDGTVLENREAKVEVKEEKKINEDETKASPDEIRGASKDEIVKLTLIRYISSLSELIGEASLDVSRIKNLLNRLSDLNSWAFNEDEKIGASLRALQDTLRLPYDDKVAQEIKLKVSSLIPLFTAMMSERGEDRGPETETRREAPPLEESLRGREAQFSGRSAGGVLKPAPATSGSTLRVKAEDVETLIRSVADLTGLEPKDFERLQAQALQLRMVPVGELLSRFRKVVRDLAEELNKEIDIEISGESVKLDKVIADRLNEPIMHLVRNAAGHGLEGPEERERAGKGAAGLIRLSAYQEGGQVVIEVSDNGRGISLEKVRKRGMEIGMIKEDEGKDLPEKAILDLIFTPGFSTVEGADRVSGRGVGMDVVKEVVTSLQGSVAIDTKEGTGTTFRLQLPLTLAIIKGMVLEQGGNRIALPANFVDRVIPMTEEELKACSIMDNNRLCLDIPGEGEVLPLVDLSQVFGLRNRSKTRCVVVVRAGMGQKAALVADSAIGRQPLMVKPLDRFAENRYFSSASFADNELILVLNTPSLMAA